MTCLSLADAKLIERFLRTQHFRHVATPKNYAGTLRSFAGFVLQHSGAAAPTIPILQQWLKDRSLKWQAHILDHRTFLVERYLQWLQNQGVIASNPFAELHRQYGPRTTPIVRALVSEDSNTLEQLRELPPFGSFLGRVMEDHVAHNRARMTNPSSSTDTVSSLARQAVGSSSSSTFRLPPGACRRSRQSA